MRDFKENHKLLAINTDILEHTVEDKYFFAAKMSIGVEISAWRPVDQGRACGSI